MRPAALSNKLVTVTIFDDVGLQAPRLERMLLPVSKKSDCEMDAFLDASVQLIQLCLLFIVITQNFSLRARLKAVERQLGAENQDG